MTNQKRIIEQLRNIERQLDRLSSELDTLQGEVDESLTEQHNGYEELSPEDKEEQKLQYDENVKAHENAIEAIESACGFAFDASARVNEAIDQISNVE